MNKIALSSLSLSFCSIINCFQFFRNFFVMLRVVIFFIATFLSFHGFSQFTSHQGGNQTVQYLVTDARLDNSEGSFDRVMQKAIIAANSGKPVELLFNVKPDPCNNTLCYMNKPLPNYVITKGSILLKKYFDGSVAPHLVPVQGFLFSESFPSIEMPKLNGAPFNMPDLTIDRVPSFNTKCVSDPCQFNLVLFPEKKFYCPGEQVQIKLTNYGGVLPIDGQFYWTPNSTISSNWTLDPTVFPLQTETYNLTLSLRYFTDGFFKCKSKSITIPVQTCVNPDEDPEILGCGLNNFGAGIYTKKDTKVNVYCHVVNELAVDKSNNLEKGEIKNKGAIISTLDWVNNGQNPLFTSSEGNVNLIGDYQRLRGMNPIRFYNLNLSGSSKKEIFNNEFVSNQLNLGNVEFALKNKTCFLENSTIVSLSRVDGSLPSSGFISTNEANGLFRRAVNGSVESGAYLFPMGSTTGGFKYRPIEMSSIDYDGRKAVHFENTTIPSEFNVAVKAPNVLSINDKYFYKIFSSVNTDDIKISMYYDPIDGNFQAVSHWANNVPNATPTSLWVNTVGMSGSTLASTDPNTLGLLNASTVGNQNYDSPAFALAKGGFVVNTTGFGNPTNSDPDVPTDIVVTVTSTGTPNDPSSGGSTGGGLGNPTGTGGTTTYTPSPVAGVYILNVDETACSSAGKIKFMITSMGEVDPTSVKFVTESGEYLLSPELFSIAQFGEFAPRSMPKSLTEICKNDISVTMGDQIGNEALVLKVSYNGTNISKIDEKIYLKRTNSSVSFIDFKIDGQPCTLINTSANQSEINNTTGALPVWAKVGSHTYELQVKVGTETKTIQGKFLIK